MDIHNRIARLQQFWKASGTKETSDTVRTFEVTGCTKRIVPVPLTTRGLDEIPVMQPDAVVNSVK